MSALPHRVTRMLGLVVVVVVGGAGARQPPYPHPHNIHTFQRVETDQGSYYQELPVSDPSRSDLPAPFPNRYHTPPPPQPVNPPQPYTQQNSWMTHFSSPAPRLPVNKPAPSNTGLLSAGRREGGTGAVAAVKKEVTNTREEGVLDWLMESVVSTLAQKREGDTGEEGGAGGASEGGGLAELLDTLLSSLLGLNRRLGRADWPSALLLSSAIIGFILHL